MIGCVIAMDSEAEILLEEMEIKEKKKIFGKTVFLGKAFGHETIVTVCGVGKGNAAAGTCAALEEGADLILNFGVAGGLTFERTKVGEIYLINQVVQYDFDLTQLNGGKVGTLDGETENFMPLFCPPSLKFPRRALGTGDRFNDSPADHALLISLGCDIREMEAGAIAQVCKLSAVPFVSIKVISDIYGSESTTEQFSRNLKCALSNLKSQLKSILEGIHYEQNSFVSEKP